MLEEVQSLMTRYQKWLRDKTVLRSLGDAVEITTPFLDRHNDYMQIVVKRSNGGFLLSDDGYTLNDLEISGCSLEKPRRQALLSTTLRGFGVQQHDRSLEVHATTDNFAARKHSLIQAMLSVNDLFHTASPMVTSLFFEDVVEWLDGHDIRYVPSVTFKGRSGNDHRFDFAIPKSRKRPERMLHLLSRPDRRGAELLAFAWMDTREARPGDSRCIALLNDSEGAVTSKVLDTLTNYEVRPLTWSSRETALEELAA